MINSLFETESVFLGEVGTIDDSEFKTSVCTDEADDLKLFVKSRSAVDPACDAVNVKACVVVVPPGNVVEKRISEDNSDAFDTADSPARLVCEAADVAETLGGGV